jgi:hypothetical protein
MVLFLELGSVLITTQISLWETPKLYICSRIRILPCHFMCWTNPYRAKNSGFKWTPASGRWDFTLGLNKDFLEYLLENDSPNQLSWKILKITMYSLVRIWLSFIQLSNFSCPCNVTLVVFSVRKIKVVLVCRFSWNLISFTLVAFVRRICSIFLTCFSLIFSDSRLMICRLILS